MDYGRLPIIPGKMGDFPICHYSTANATNACALRVPSEFIVHQAASIPASLKHRRSRWDDVITNKRTTSCWQRRYLTWPIQLSWIGHSATLRVIAIMQQNYRANIYTVDYDANPNL